MYFRTAKYPQKLTSQKNRIIKVRIGQPFSVQNSERNRNLAEFSRSIAPHKHIHAFPNHMKRKGSGWTSIQQFKIPKAPQKIGPLL